MPQTEGEGRTHDIDRIDRTPCAWSDICGLRVGSSCHDPLLDVRQLRPLVCVERHSTGCLRRWSMVGRTRADFTCFPEGRASRPSVCVPGPCGPLRRPGAEFDLQPGTPGLLTRSIRSRASTRRTIAAAPDGRLRRALGFFERASCCRANRRGEALGKKGQPTGLPAVTKRTTGPPPTQNAAHCSMSFRRRSSSVERR